jgi:hypothetical protein
MVMNTLCITFPVADKHKIQENAKLVAHLYLAYYCISKMYSSLIVALVAIGKCTTTRYYSDIREFTQFKGKCMTISQNCKNARIF